jgi:hypothetical protein
MAAFHSIIYGRFWVITKVLIAQRGKLHADSDQTRRLDMEIAAVRDLVRSYRIVKVLSSQ